MFDRKDNVQPPSRMHEPTYCTAHVSPIGSDIWTYSKYICGTELAIVLAVSKSVSHVRVVLYSAGRVKSVDIQEGRPYLGG